MGNNGLFKVVVAGGRDFKDYDLLCQKLDHLLQNKQDIEIVSGNAMGADRLGERYAIEKGYTLIKFPADWTCRGKSAGPIRNRQMAEHCDAVVVFWNGVSRGSLNMIETAKELNKPVKIIRY